MKRIHIHLNVDELKHDATVAFYSTLFGAEPTLTREHYVKWLLDDPAVNFTVEMLEVAGDVPGIHHVEIQVDGDGELEAIRKSLEDAEAPPLEIGRMQCCFADSEKTGPPIHRGSSGKRSSRLVRSIATARSPARKCLSTRNAPAMIGDTRAAALPTASRRAIA